MADFSSNKVNPSIDYAGKDHGSNVDRYVGSPDVTKARFDALLKWFIENKFNVHIDDLDAF